MKSKPAKVRLHACMYSTAQLHVISTIGEADPKP